MKHLAWLALTLALFAATLLLTEWSDTRDLSHQREWDVARADGAEGELDGLRFSVREARAVVVASKPDRALVLVRLAVQGSPKAASQWIDCRASLRGKGGETWLPLYTASSSGAIRLMAPDGKDNGTCLVSGVSETGPTLSDHLYRLPSADLDDLTLRVSGYGTRPSALAFPIRPTVRTIKPGQ